MLYFQDHFDEELAKMPAYDVMPAYDAVLHEWPVRKLWGCCYERSGKPSKENP